MSVLKIFTCFFTVFVVNGSSFHGNFQSGSSSNETTNPQDVFRLPNLVIPISYELRMAPDLENFTFRGEVKIIVRATFTTDRIHLHSRNLIIGNVTVTRLGFQTNTTFENTTTFVLDEDNDILSIETGQNFDFNTDYKVSITFEGVLHDYGYDEDQEAIGFYRTSYKIGNKTRWLATTQFEATGARRAFPCFDEPRYRTPFTIYLARPKQYIAVSNMPREKIVPSDPLNKDLIWDKFKPTPPMPTYLVALMVSDFRTLKSDIDKRVRAIVRPNGINRSHYALTQFARLLKYFEGYFGIPYNLPKLDLVSVPHFPEGMENWGMIVCNEANVIIKNNESEELKRNSVILISHEISHLWFGDLVTPAWYDYLWIKEGFATYFQSFGTAAIEPSWNEDQIFVVETVQECLGLYEDRTKSMTRQIRTFDGIDSSYDGLSYNKAGSVIRMFELMLSPSTFQNALHNYLIDGHQNHKGVAVPRHLFDAFDAQVELDSVSHLPPHVTASDIMKTWSENTGYPLIEVIRSYETGTVTITQMPFKSSRTNETYIRDEKWIVPLTFTTKSRLDFSNTLPSHWSFADEPLVLHEFNSSDWILFNIKQSGFYRVNYDSENWDLLTDQLLQDHTEIDVLNRAQIIDDAIALAVFGRIRFTIVARILEYLSNETNIIPWYSASRSLMKIVDLSRFNISLEKTIQKNFQDILTAGIKNLGCSISPSDDHVVKILKPEFLNFMNKLGMKDCVDELLTTYRNNYNNLNDIQPDLKPAVLCNALRHSPEPKIVYQHLWDAYKNSTKAQEKKQIMASIFTCLNNEEIIKSLMWKIFDPENQEISKPDGLHIIKKLISEVPAVTASIKFINEKIIPIQSKLDDEGNTLLESLVTSISSNLITDEQNELCQKMKSKLSTNISKS